MKSDGKITFNRFRSHPVLQQGLEKGGPLLVQASDIVQRNGGSISEDPYDGEDELERAIAQERALEAWARSEGCWIEDVHAHFRKCNFPQYGYGNEAQIFAEGDRFVHKYCRITNYDSPQRFFDRLAIENALCPEASLTVEGFSRDRYGNFSVVMKQVFFRQGRSLSSGEIMQYMDGLGFKSEIDPRYRTIKYLSDIIIVEDLHPGNIWETPDGHVVIIDGVFLLNTPGQGFGGTFHFGQ